ncbi:MAG: UDP-glucose 4-epimerase GalE [Spirochaetales bacterium]|jgi:UDP-glucose 4-epimerase|nr:UDP-glucose 4-epimerase GalE [Spirochaetales bacterium]
MRALVIGGAGYIGSHVTRRLLDAGDTVCVYDNMSSGVPENIFPEAQFIRGDILDYPALLAALKKGWDAVVYLAALKAVGESMEYPEKYSVNNIIGTVNILNAMCESNVKNICFSSSAAVYGEPVKIPIDETHPLNPENYYGFTKVEIERFLGWYDRLKGIRYASLRYFNAAGYDPQGRVRGKERNPANLLPIIMETAAGLRPKLQIFGDDYPTRDGTCVRDYIHVSDLAEAHVLALKYIREKNSSLTVNLGSETGVSVKEMLEASRRITGRPIPSEIAPRRPGDPASLTASAAKAKETLGWKASRSDVDTLISSTWNIYA